MRGWRNGTLEHDLAAIVGVRPLLVGDALTDTLRVERGRPIGLEHHIARMVRAAAASGHDWAEPGATFRAAIAPAIEASEHSGTQALRVFAYAGSRPAAPEVLVTLDPYSPPGEDEYAQGTRLHLSDVIHPCNGIYGKTTSRHWAETAQRLALRAGFEGAVLCDRDGYVVESTHSTLLWLRRGHWFTVPEERGGLVSTTLGVLEERGLGVGRELVRPAELTRSDAIVLVSALRIAVGVSTLEDREFPQPDEAARELRELVLRG